MRKYKKEKVNSFVAPAKLKRRFDTNHERLEEKVYIAENIIKPCMPETVGCILVKNTAKKFSTVLCPNSTLRLTTLKVNSSKDEMLLICLQCILLKVHM